VIDNIIIIVVIGFVTFAQSLMKASKTRPANNKFSKLEAAIDRDNTDFLNDTQQQQQVSIYLCLSCV
jgi:hypothetical protein